MNVAKITTLLIVPSKSPTVAEAKNAVIRLTNNHGNLLFTDSFTVLSTFSSPSTPPRRCISSVVSSFIISITSSIVIIPKSISL